jgi:very-short-patch-repair endonuclease
MKLDPQLIEKARSLRRNLAPAERKLWSTLRGRRFAEVKFRRQQVFGSYVVDFFCARALLVVELDRESHLGQGTADSNRQQWLESCAVKVLRFWNTQVFDEYNAVLEAIWHECSRRCKDYPLTPNPSPPEGRGANV